MTRQPAGPHTTGDRVSPDSSSPASDPSGAGGPAVPFENLSDAELVGLVGRRNKQAREILRARHGRAVLGLIRISLADDTFVEVLERDAWREVSRRAGSYNPASRSFHAFACDVVTSCCADLELALRFRNGDKEAFDVLWATHLPSVRAFIGHRLYDANARRIDDVVQQTSAAVWRDREYFDPLRGPLSAWILQWAERSVKRAVSRKDPEVKHSTRIPTVADLQSDADRSSHDHFLENLANRSDTAVSQERRSILSEQEAERLRLAGGLLALTLAGPNPPHQSIAFLCKLLQWKPAEVVAAHSDTPLATLAVECERECVGQSELPPEAVHRCFIPLHERMAELFEVAVHEEKTQGTYPDLRGREVGKTTLRDYFTGATPTEQAEDLTAWWWAVKRRMIVATVRAWLLDVAVRSPSQPHEILAFVFRYVLERSAARIVAEHSSTTLAALTGKVEEEYTRQSHLPPMRTHSSFAPLRARMKDASEVAVTDGAVRRDRADPCGRPVGETTLGDYCTGAADKERQANVEGWSNSVCARAVAVARSDASPIFDILDAYVDRHATRKSSPRRRPKTAVAGGADGDCQ